MQKTKRTPQKIKRITFFFGAGKDKDGRTITEEQRLSALANIGHMAVVAYGGYTMIDTVGGWTNSSGERIQEPGIQLIILCSDQGNYVGLARAIKTEFNQTEVLVILEDVSIEGA